MKKFLLAVACLVTIITTTAGFYAEKTQADLKDHLLRLHIIARSDDAADQEMKLKIRDKLLAAYGNEFGSNVEEAKAIIETKLPEIEEEVNRWLAEEGADYTAEAVLTEDEFPTKVYGNVKLPAGDYTALKVILGGGRGQNWWCVMFPPICFVDGTTGMMDAQSEEYLKNNLSQDEYRLITEDSANVEIRFKIVELWQKLKW